MCECLNIKKYTKSSTCGFNEFLKMSGLPNGVAFVICFQVKHISYPGYIVEMYEAAFLHTFAIYNLTHYFCSLFNTNILVIDCYDAVVFLILRVEKIRKFLFK